jgi:hypothetical protein
VATIAGLKRIDSTAERVAIALLVSAPSSNLPHISTPISTCTSISISAFASASAATAN